MCTCILTQFHYSYTSLSVYKTYMRGGHTRALQCQTKTQPHCHNQYSRAGQFQQWAIPDIQRKCSPFATISFKEHLAFARVRPRSAEDVKHEHLTAVGSLLETRFPELPRPTLRTLSQHSTHTENTLLKANQDQRSLPQELCRLSSMGCRTDKMLCHISVFRLRISQASSQVEAYPHSLCRSSQNSQKIHRCFFKKLTAYSRQVVLHYGPKRMK